ncbi:MAG TPA: SDR family oxidoreductase [Candidatus Saccharimonadales bacterium]
MNALIIGGTSGLGLELARRWAEAGDSVVITGRTAPAVPQQRVLFHKLDLDAADLPQKMAALVKDLPRIDVLVYAAGFYQEGTITDLSEADIEKMLNVGGRGLVFGLRALLQKQAELPEFISITSSSQYVPRQLEPIYNFVKAGAGHLAASMAEDGRIAKVLHVAPSGMQTAFWRDQPSKDVSGHLDPKWVADEIDKLRKKDYRYKYVRIQRDPARVEEVETK